MPEVRTVFYYSLGIPRELKIKRDEKGKISVLHKLEHYSSPD
jgi:hypothetical protein